MATIDTIRAIALIEREYSIARRDPISIACSEDLSGPYIRRVQSALADVPGGYDELRAALRECTREQLEAMIAEVEAALPDPWSDYGKPPVCVVCQSDQFDAKNPPDGYRFVRPRDPEDGPGEWFYGPHLAVCDACMHDPEEDVAWGEAAEASAMFEDDPEYERYCLECELVGFLAERADEQQETFVDHSPGDGPLDELHEDDYPKPMR